ncbi:DUF2271 domain-containing protein [Pseudomonas protegens]|uniref:DUF2271 domain-containing protein n=1 Tax=Pseudomonas protegens TaxID=380021 RepID=UPI001B31A985|nr:DUF2271 domain-containing protein [Pseudomonas protegens]MBP5125803.1 DUF2271 domain-containing protein [Pseudomonas protegens]
MHKLVVAGCLATALALPALAQAREVTLTTHLKPYSGSGAYLAIYLTDASGTYQKTLWVAGKKAKYYKHLPGWARGGGMSAAQYDGVTGASVGSGESLTVSAELADSLIDAGYQIRIDSGVEDQRDIRADVILPLTLQGAGQPASGGTYVQSLRYDL